MAYCEHVDCMKERCCYECMLKICNRPLTLKEEFINKHWDYWSDEGLDDQFDRWNKKRIKKQMKNYLYLTLSPDKQLRNLEVNDANKKELVDWCEEWFKWGLKRWYTGYIYEIECGSNGDHLHVHCVMEMKSSHKHAETLKKSWSRVFPGSQLITTLNLGSKSNGRGEYAYLRFDDPEILEDKINYFDDAKKGHHANLYDLGLRGSGGSLLTVGGDQPPKNPHL
jgi:hypothetical protein